MYRGLSVTPKSRDNLSTYGGDTLVGIAFMAKVYLIGPAFPLQARNQGESA